MFYKSIGARNGPERGRLTPTAAAVYNDPLDSREDSLSMCPIKTPLSGVDRSKMLNLVLPKVVWWVGDGYVLRKEEKSQRSLINLAPWN